MAQSQLWKPCQLQQRSVNIYQTGIGEEFADTLESKQNLAQFQIVTADQRAVRRPISDTNWQGFLWLKSMLSVGHLFTLPRDLLRECRLGRDAIPALADNINSVRDAIATALVGGPLVPYTRDACVIVKILNNHPEKRVLCPCPKR